MLAWFYLAHAVALRAALRGGGAIKRRGLNGPVSGYGRFRCGFLSHITYVSVMFLTIIILCAKKSPITCGPQGNMVSRYHVELQGGELLGFAGGNAPEVKATAKIQLFGLTLRSAGHQQQKLREMAGDNMGKHPGIVYYKPKNHRARRRSKRPQIHNRDWCDV